jgi:type II secretory pathway component PulM
MKPKVNDELMLKYLLGELSEEEQSKFEEEFLTNDQAYEQLVVLEDELVYEYLQGELTPAQRERFAQRFLNSPEGRQKAVFAQLLTDKAAEYAPPGRSRQTSEIFSVARSWWHSLQSLISLPSPGLRLAYVAAAATVLVGFSWLLFENVLKGRMTQQEQPIAELRQQSLSKMQQETPPATPLPAPPPKIEQEELQRELSQLSSSAQMEKTRGTPTFIALALTPGLLRDDAGIIKVIIKPGIDELQLELAIKFIDEYRSFKPVLKTVEGTEIALSRAVLKAKGTPSGNVGVMRVPASVFQSGDYVLTLSGERSTGQFEEIDDYYFSVIKE